MTEEYMKKIILLALTMILAISCNSGKINGIQLNKGDTKTYETKDYLIIYEVESFNGFGQPFWKFKKLSIKKIHYEETYFISTYSLDDDWVQI